MTPGASRRLAACVIFFCTCRCAAEGGPGARGWGRLPVPASDGRHVRAAATAKRLMASAASACLRHSRCLRADARNGRPGGALRTGRLTPAELCDCGRHFGRCRRARRSCNAGSRATTTASAASASTALASGRSAPRAPSATLSLVRFGQALSVPSVGRTLLASGAVRLGRRGRLGELAACLFVHALACSDGPTPTSPIPGWPPASRPRTPFSARGPTGVRRRG